MNFLLRSASALALALAALAVQADTLYDNLDQGAYDYYSVDRADYLANRFATGGSAEALADVTIIALDGGSLTNGTNMALSLYSQSGDVPGVSLGSLGAATSAGTVGGYARYSFAGNGLALAANTQYWIVATPINDGVFAGWGYTDFPRGSGTTPASALGLANSVDRGANYHNSGSADGVALMSVTANPVPEPSALATLGLGGLAVLRRRRK